MKLTDKNLRKVICRTALLSLFWAVIRKLETRVREGDQAGSLQASEDGELGREARPQLGEH